VTAPFDKTDFIDRELQASQATRAGTLLAATTSAGGGATTSPRPPTREELETKVSEAQSRIAELKRAQDQLERERVALEDARRRRAEFARGRAEMVEHLTRGIGLLEKAEGDARRTAEQLTKTLTGFRETLAQVQSVREEAWTQENWNAELTRALTAVENARMEWNAGRLKWPVLNGTEHSPADHAARGDAPSERRDFGAQKFGTLCKVGLALTWPVAVAVLLAVLSLHLLR